MGLRGEDLEEGMSSYTSGWGVPRNQGNREDVCRFRGSDPSEWGGDKEQASPVPTWGRRSSPQLIGDIILTTADIAQCSMLPQGVASM